MIQKNIVELLYQPDAILQSLNEPLSAAFL